MGGSSRIMWLYLLQRAERAASAPATQTHEAQHNVQHDEPVSIHGRLTTTDFFLFPPSVKSPHAFPIAVTPSTDASRPAALQPQSCCFSVSPANCS